MARSFAAGPNEVSLGMSAYMLTLAVFIPVSGWIADRFGSRTVFCGALVIFTAASVLCGFSVGVASFTAARVLQGIGGAMMVPVGRWRASAHQLQLTINKNNNLCSILTSDPLNRRRAARECLAGWH